MAFFSCLSPGSRRRADARIPTPPWARGDAHERIHMSNGGQRAGGGLFVAGFGSPPSDLK